MRFIRRLRFDFERRGSRSPIRLGIFICEVCRSRYSLDLVLRRIEGEAKTVAIARMFLKGHDRADSLEALEWLPECIGG